MKVQSQNHLKVHTIAASRIRHLLIAWLAAATTEWLLLPVELKTMTGLKGLSAMSLPRLLIVTGIVLVMLEAISRLLPRSAERWMMAGLFAVLAATTVAHSFTWPLLLACGLVFAMLVIFACKGWNNGPVPKTDAQKSPIAAGLTAVLAVGFFLLVSAWTVGRVYSFSTPT